MNYRIARNIWNNYWFGVYVFGRLFLRALFYVNYWQWKNKLKQPKDEAP